VGRPLGRNGSEVHGSNDVMLETSTFECKTKHNAGRTGCSIFICYAGCILDYANAIVLVVKSAA